MTTAMPNAEAHPAPEAPKTPVTSAPETGQAVADPDRTFQEQP